MDALLRMRMLSSGLADRQGIASLEYAVLAAMVVGVVAAASTGVAEILGGLLQAMAGAAEGPGVVVRPGSD